MSQPHRERRDDGEFHHRHPIEIRYVDTDALGHVNNAVYLSYFEAARAGYYAAVAGRPFGTGEGAERETFLIAQAHVAYRSPARFGEPLTCLCRVAWIGRSSFGLEYRLMAEPSTLGPARLVADGSTVQVFYDLRTGKVIRIPGPLRERIQAFEGRQLPGR
jgi:acyl-CoA thioester hydrolase